MNTASPTKCPGAKQICSTPVSQPFSGAFPWPPGDVSAWRVGHGGPQDGSSPWDGANASHSPVLLFVQSQQHSGVFLARVMKRCCSPLAFPHRTSLPHSCPRIPLWKSAPPSASRPPQHPQTLWGHLIPPSMGFGAGRGWCWSPPLPPRISAELRARDGLEAKIPQR